MKLDSLVRQRFDELAQKADTISKQKKLDFQSLEGVNYYDVDSASYRAWATSVLNLLQRVFGENSIHYQNFSEQYKLFDGNESRFEESRAIFLAAREDYEGGYLFNLRGLVKAEDSTETLEQADALLNANYKDPACILAGVALEIAIKELCARSSIPHAKLDAMNIELCKKGIYNMGMQKQVTAWAHWRNKAAHGEWNEYTKDDVQDMIKGVTRFVADYL